MSKQAARNEKWSPEQWIEYLCLSLHSLTMENQIRKAEIERLKAQIAAKRSAQPKIIDFLSRKPGAPDRRAGRRIKTRISHTKPMRAGLFRRRLELTPAQRALFYTPASSL